MENTKKQALLSAYGKFIIALQDQNQYKNDGRRTTELVPFLTEQIGDDKIFNTLSRETISCVWRTISQGGKLEKFIIYDVYSSKNPILEFVFKHPNKDWPDVSVAVCGRSKKAIILLQLDCENHVLVSPLKKGQANDLIVNLIKGDLKDELTNLLGVNHQFINQLQIYTDNHQFATVTAA